MSQNLRRSIEYWLAEGGSDLGERGGEFETHVRRHLADAVAQNTLLRGVAGVAQEAVKPSIAEVGDIDLLAWIDNVVLVGEVKCVLRPGTSLERYKLDGRLREAAEQAARKAAYVRDNREWLLSACPGALTLNGKELSVLPCVLLNSAVGALRSIDGVPIVDRYILQRYFGEGFARMNASLEDENSGTRVNFYSTAAEAAAGLGRYISFPTHLSPLRQAVKKKTWVQPDFTAQSKFVAAVYPTVHVPRPPKAGAAGEG